MSDELLTRTRRERHGAGRTVAAGLALVLTLAGAAGLTGLGGCERPAATQVMLHIDVEPGVRATARAVEVRVFDSSGTERGRERIAVDVATEWPLRLPLVPEGGDASRTWLVEAAVRGERDAIVALARSRGGYERDALRSALLCVFDGCEGTACGLVESTCLAGAPCRSCEAGGVCAELPQRAELVVGAGPLRCPARASDASVDGHLCVPSGSERDRERCSNGLDDDCDERTDCEDPGCEDTGCDAAGGVCCDGACVDTWSRTEHCGGCGLACAAGAACVRIPAASGGEAPGAGCECEEAACPDGTFCGVHDGVAMCGCGAATCGGDRVCIGEMSDHHAYCGYP